MMQADKSSPIIALADWWRATARSPRSQNLFALVVTVVLPGSELWGVFGGRGYTTLQHVVVRYRRKFFDASGRTLPADPRELAYQVGLERAVPTTGCRRIARSELEPAGAAQEHIWSLVPEFARRLADAAIAQAIG